MICMVRTLGAPVIDAQGNTAFRIVEREASVRAVLEDEDSSVLHPLADEIPDPSDPPR